MKVTLYLDKVPLKEAMDKLFEVNNLTYEFDEVSRIIIVKPVTAEVEEPITKVFTLKYASVSTSSLQSEMSTNLSSIGKSAATTGRWKTEGEAGITNVIKKLLSKKENIIEDPRTNSLIITDFPSKFPMIEETIRRLDIPVPQVMLEVEMLNVNKNKVDKIGIKFGQTPFAITLKGAIRDTFWPFDSTLPIVSGQTLDKTPGSISVSQGTSENPSYTVLLDFLKTQSDTKYLARPRILTLNNETAEIKIVTQESIGVNTTTQGTTTTQAEAERAETGVSLRVTPQINSETGEITMFIYPQVSEATQGNLITSESKNFQYRDPEVRSTKCVVRVKDGETVIVGGLIRSEYTATITKLPLLGDIPVLGALFRHKDKTRDRERELLVFITPRIIKEQPTQLTKLENVGIINDREQTTEPVYERQKFISNSLNNFEGYPKN